MDYIMNRKMKIIIFELLAGFVLYNLVWSMYVTVTYRPFIDKLGGVKRLETDEYTYSIKTPNYLSFTGNLSISENVKVYPNDEGINAGSIMIWPKFHNKFLVAFNVSKTTVNIETRNTHTDIIGIMLDQNKEPDFSVPGVYKLYNENKELFDSSKEDIEKLYTEAYKTWGILGP